ncbi:MAG: hypothetical protein PVG92_07000 [Holophagae bacterium]|jgi:hypothetical protein
MTMKVSNCPNHGDLMRELARGHLDDERSFAAESVREQCPHCGRWWEGAFGGEAYEVVEAAVADAIADFSPPARRRREWLAAAAAIIFAIGLAGVSTLWRGDRAIPSHAEGVVSTMNFETGAVAETVTEAAETTNEDGEAAVEAAVFSNDLESGDLSSWASHS